MSHDQPGQDDPRGGRDEFDHFFSDRRADSEHRDPDATQWQGASAGPFSDRDTGSGSESTDPDATAFAEPSYTDSDRTHATEHAPYVRPPQPQHDEYQPADRGGYQQPAGYFEERPQRRGAMWAPVAVIVASLAIVVVVIALILNNSSGKMAQGAFTPTQTVTRTSDGQSTSQSQSSSSSSSSSSSGSSSSSKSSSSSSSPSYATDLPAAASSCPGTDSYGTGPKTSCTFAGVVSTLYNAKKDEDGKASFQAKSPTTHDNYNVSCGAESYVTCTTETGAIIYILRK